MAQAFPQLVRAQGTAWLTLPQTSSPWQVRLLCWPSTPSHLPCLQFGLTQVVHCAVLAPGHLDPLPVVMAPTGGAPQQTCTVFWLLPCLSENKDGSGKLNLSPPSARSHCTAMWMRSHPKMTLFSRASSVKDKSLLCPW